MHTLRQTRRTQRQNQRKYSKRDARPSSNHSNQAPTHTHTCIIHTRTHYKNNNKYAYAYPLNCTSCFPCCKPQRSKLTHTQTHSHKRVLLMNSAESILMIACCHFILCRNLHTLLSSILIIND